jgi:hypothetical protein
MRNYRSGITCLLAALLVVFVAGCGQETVSLPGVISVTPAQGATGVLINTTVTATFSMAMNPASITTSTFTLTGPGGTAVAGAVGYSGSTATFTPSAVLAYGTTYTATITTAASSPGGAELIGPYVWSFTTITPPPAVVATVPANGATNVPIGQVLSATFSEAMNSATISATTFTLTVTGGAAVTGTVSYSWRSCDVYAQRSSGQQHQLHGHNHNGGYLCGGHSARGQLRLEIYNHHTAARCHMPRSR